MTRVAAILAWLALLVGIPQVLLGILGLYGGGVRMMYFATLIVLPFMPLLLRNMQQRRAAPLTSAPLFVVMLAMASIAVSVWTYFDVIRAFGED